MKNSSDEKYSAPGVGNLNAKQRAQMARDLRELESKGTIEFVDGVASCIAEQCGLTPFAKVGAVLRKSAAPAVLCNHPNLSNLGFIACLCATFFPVPFL
jgi:hypothetical protein